MMRGFSFWSELYEGKRVAILENLYNKYSYVNANIVNTHSSDVKTCKIKI